MSQRSRRRCRFQTPALTPELEAAVADAQAQRVAKIHEVQMITARLNSVRKKSVRFAAQSRDAPPSPSPHDVSVQSVPCGRKTPDARFYRKHYRRGLATGAVRPARTVTKVQLHRAEVFNFAIEPVPFTQEETRKYRAFASTAEGLQPLANVFAHTRGGTLRLFGVARPQTRGERAANGMSRTAGGGHNAGSGNGCNPAPHIASVRLRSDGERATAGLFQPLGANAMLGVGTAVTLRPPRLHCGQQRQRRRHKPRKLTLCP